METRGRSSSKRKPLADCTNTIAAASRRSFSPSAAKSSVGVTAPPKPSKPKPPTSSSSHKTNTSTGSNNPPIVDCALFVPHSSDPPAPPTPLSDSGGKNRRKFGPSAPQCQQDEKIMKEKGNISSETFIIQASKVTHQALLKSSVFSGNYHLSHKSQIQDGSMARGALNTMITKNSIPHVPPKSSSAASGNCRLLGSSAIPKKMDAEIRKGKGKMVSGTPNIETTDLFRPPHVPLASSSGGSGSFHLSGPSAVQDHKLDAQGKKDKGKLVLETPIIVTADHSKSHVPLASSSAASDNWHSSDPPAVQDQNLDAQKRKDKGKMVLEIPIIEITDVMGPHMSLASSSAASGNCHFPESPAVQNQEMDAQIRKDKGKTVLDIPNIETTNLLIPHMSPASSSAAFSNCNLSGPSAVQNKRLDKQERIDEGKQLLETQNIETNDSRRLQVPPTSSSAASGNHYLFGLPLVENQKVDAARSKGKGKTVQETIDIEATDPSTPHAPMSSSSATSGTCDQERPDFLTVYNQRRSSRRRTRADGKSVALSCPPNKRTKNMRMELGDDCGKKKSGSHTDPLPMHKKSRKKHDDSVHIMPQDEIERLKAYYAEIDAFELPEEAASDSD